jgi:hypothetical protein
VEQEYITDEFGITRLNPNYTGGVFNPQNPYAQNAMQPYWQSVDQASGNPQNFSQTMAAIESQGGQNLTSGTGAVGPFQFTGIAAQQVGIPKDQTVDPYIGAQAAAELASQNRQRFVQAYGREPNGFELYMMHQQGANGAMASLGAVDGTTINQMSPTVRSNILAQGIQGITGQSLVSDFVDIFDKKYSQYEPFTGQTLQPQNSQMGQGYVQPEFNPYGMTSQDAFGFNAGGNYTGGIGNAQYQKGGSTGPQYVTDQYGVTRAVQSYGNNEYGYGGGYDPQAYGYGGTNYSTGNPQNATTATQNAQYMNYSGQPDITVYANDPWGNYSGGSMGVADGGYGNMGSEGGIAGGGTVGASDGGFTYDIGNQYFDASQQNMQNQYDYSQQVQQQNQQQLNNTIASLNPSLNTNFGGGSYNSLMGW